MRILLILIIIFLSPVLQAQDYLIIGDSHTCGAFGKKLVQNFITQNNTVTLFCATSSAASHWVNGVNPAGQKCFTFNSKNFNPKLCDSSGKLPSLVNLLLDFKNETILVALGTNSLLSSQPDAYYSEFIQILKSNQRSCVWVGPPHLFESNSKGFPKGRLAAMENNLIPFMYSLEKLLANTCSLINSDKFTADGTLGMETTDGVHRTNRAGAYWAEQVYRNNTFY